MSKKFKKELSCLMTLAITLGSLSGMAPVNTYAAESLTQTELSATVNEDDASETTAYLSDWDWISAKTDWDVVRKDTGVEGKTISLIVDDNGTRATFNKAIAAHAASEVVFDIEGKGVKRFQSYVGVNCNQGDCGFIVKTDLSDTPLYEIKKVSYTDKVAYIDVEIPADATRLILITNDGGDGNSYDHSIWAEPKVIMDTAVSNSLSKVTLNAPAYLPLNGTAKTSVSAKLGNGTLIDLNDAEVSVTSSNEEVLAIDENGNLTGLADGMAVLTASVTFNGITKTASAEVIVGEAADSVWKLTSEDESISAVFYLANGTAHYFVTEDDSMVVETSDLGIVTDDADFTTGLTYVSSSEITEVTDSYDLIGAKVSHVDAVGKEMTITFAKDDLELDVIARIYDDGLAFRYAIDGSGTINISAEDTNFRIPDGSTAYAMSYIAHNKAVETKYEALENLNSDYCEPLLYETENGTWTLVSEAALNGNYCGTFFRGDGSGSINFHFAKEQSGKVTSTLPFESPWRYFVIGTAAEINENTMGETLSPDCEGDFSWVQPGVTSWTWLNRESTSSGETYLKYIDFAAEMGWEYLLLDEGWQPSGSSIGKVYAGYFDWFDEVLEHAKEKGIRLLVWANHNDLKDDAYREQLFAEWEEMGIAGVKPDFFDSSSQTYMKLYDELIEDTAKYHLLLNLHGIPKPAGERRTYPHLLTREGVFGHEQELFRASQMSAYHNCMLPFVRNAVGPADYTPMFSYRNSGTARNFSLAQMAAMAVVYESGIQCLADRPEEYLGSAAELYFRDMPAAWDETHVLEADPGNLVITARRSGNAWYVGGMCDDAYTAKLDLSFLGEGTYYALICKDGETITEITNELKIVTSEDTLTIPMLKTGGFAIRFMTEDPSADALTISASKLDLYAYDTAELTASATKNGEAVNTSVVWTSSNETVATVSGGTVTGISAGSAVITATVKGFSEDISVSCNVTVYPPEYELADGWKLVNGDDREHWSFIDEDTVTILTQYGDYYYSNGVRATAKNIFLHDVKDTDFEISVKLDYQPDNNFESAGIMIYRADNANFTFSRRYHTYFETHSIGTHGINTNSFPETHEADPSATQAPIYLKIVKTGTTLKCYYSLDNKATWTQHGGSITWSSFAGADASDLKVGLYTGDSMSNNNTSATFSDFTIKYTDSEELSVPFAVKNEMPEEFAIVTQPTDTAAVKGANASVFVEATGQDLTYAWYYKNPGNTKFYRSSEQFVSENGTSYSIPMYSWRDGQQVYCVITDGDGNTLETDIVTLTLDQGSIQITKQPENCSAANGENAIVTIEASGDDLTYTWYYKNPGNSRFYQSGEQFVSEDGASYSLSMNKWRDGQQVYCIVTDANGISVQSDVVTLSMAK